MYKGKKKKRKKRNKEITQLNKYLDEAKVILRLELIYIMKKNKKKMPSKKMKIMKSIKNYI